jgi:hypothetical protein
MMRFIDLGKQISADESDPEYPRQFAFYNTISDQFVVVNGGTVFDTWNEFLDQAALDLTVEEINRLKSLCPEWVFQ